MATFAVTGITHHCEGGHILNPIASKLRTAQIGKCGELLVQYRLLLLGVESAPLSTDSGIDLVAYAAARPLPLTIQVKTNLKPKPGGGVGKAALDWWVSETSPAQYIALVDLSTEKVWSFSQHQLAAAAQQNSSGRYHLYMYTDPSVRPRQSNRLSHSHEFGNFLLSNCAGFVLGVYPVWSRQFWIW